MVDFKLGGVQETKARMSGGIKLGVVKFILRALTAMGYQVLHLVPIARVRRCLCVRACVPACVPALNSDKTRVLVCLPSEL